MQLIPAIIIFFLAVPMIGALEAAPKKFIISRQALSTGSGDALNDLPVPTWVWGKDQTKTQFVRTTFNTPANLESARIVATCDNALTLWINGKEVAKSNDWKNPVDVNVLANLAKTGKNVIAIKAESPDGAAGLIAKLVLNSKGGVREIVMTGNDGWKLSETEAAGWQAVAFDDRAWQQPEKIAALGAQPWGILDAKAGGGSAPSTSQLKIAPGFRVELLYTVPTEEQGSWVAITKDPAGRFITSDQPEIRS